ncbi:MAG TPA: hypothetical protein VK635_25740 [Bradyrhizobium sp.]|nr:hypothetical protein [Bradyrhizobium sp.]
MSPATRPSWLAGIMAASPEALGLVMLEADVHAWRLDRATQLAAVRDALADGAATAEALRARFPELAPHEIAAELNVPVAETDADPLVGSLWRFAEYQGRPARILLYSRGLAPLDGVIAGRLAARLLGPATPREVFIAHELFHHIEATRSETPIARRYQPSLFRIGGWRWRTGIAALAEIAAGAFAQSLLDLPCHPRVLDLLALEAVAPNATAARIAARIAATEQMNGDAGRKLLP